MAKKIVSDLNVQGKKVLIVDDNKVNIKIASRLLERYKFDIETAMSGIECINLIKNNKYEDIRLYNQKYHSDIDFTRLFKIWNDMCRRCNKPTHKRYSDYGGRGITVCEEWNNSFETFYHWAINNGYNNSLTIDRIDNDKGYFPNNCKWATYEEQANNKRTCHYITYNGETHTIKEWGKINNINPTTIRTRIHAGWNEIDAITL